MPVPTYKLSDDSRLHVHRYPRSLRVRALVVQISAQRLTSAVAGPRQSGHPSFRLDFNPSKLSADGVAELMGLLGGWIAEDPTIFFYSGKISRCDAAIDCPGYRNDEVIIRARRLQKHGVYILGHQLVNLANPFAGIELLPANFSGAADLGIPA